MTKKRRVYISRVVGDQVMTPTNLQRLHKELLEFEHIDFISDEMREVIEDLWPAHQRCRYGCGPEWRSSRSARNTLL
jgi:hypothetical protein